MKIGVNNTITATWRISIYHDHTVQLIYFKKDLPDDFSGRKTQMILKRGDLKRRRVNKK
jgi:hypothetical protein